ncbi:MAG: PaaI family thioesterase [Breznakibacter sp.]
MKTARPITNPFTSKEPDIYQCFGCSPHNPIGLKLEFAIEGDEVVGRWMPQKQYEGYVDVVHGGIQATLLDEIASWYVYAIIGSAGVTKKMEVEYHHPAATTEPFLELRASLHSKTDKEALLNTRLYNASGKLCTTALIAYAVFPETVARRKFFYPGKEAFIEKNSTQL